MDNSRFLLKVKLLHYAVRISLQFTTLKAADLILHAITFVHLIRKFVPLGLFLHQY
uniref:Uncharacterized protein n=1 Tax=Anguilla anguilla TaxID=7936 RepID=A0A0E9VHP9_ANGAN